MTTHGSFVTFFEQPIALTLITLTVVGLAWRLLRWLIARRGTQDASS